MGCGRAPGDRQSAAAAAAGDDEALSVEVDDVLVEVFDELLEEESPVLRESVL
jgi:hypothetical protein